MLIKPPTDDKVADVESPLVAESPPSYDSIFGRMKLAKENSNGSVDFVKNCFSILLGSLACTISLGILLAVPISMIVIGTIYLHDCPAERMIPIYLIVAGCFGLVSGLISLCKSVNSRDNPDNSSSTLGPEQLINTFLFAWFIAGNVWVYGKYNSWQRSDTTLTTYCDPTLYYFSFWIITSSYIIAGVCCLCCITVTSLSIFVG